MSIKLIPNFIFVVLCTFLFCLDFCFFMLNMIRVPSRWCKVLVLQEWFVFDFVIVSWHLIWDLCNHMRLVVCILYIFKLCMCVRSIRKYARPSIEHKTWILIWWGWDIDLKFTLAFIVGLLIMQSWHKVLHESNEFHHMPVHFQ